MLALALGGTFLDICDLLHLGRRGSKFELCAHVGPGQAKPRVEASPHHTTPTVEQAKIKKRVRNK